MQGESLMFGKFCKKLTQMDLRCVNTCEQLFI